MLLSVNDKLGLFTICVLCLNSVAAESRHCTISLTTEPQHVVSGVSRSQFVQSDANVCGVSSQPWSIEALTGQQISVKILAFGKW